MLGLIPCSSFLSDVPPPSLPERVGVMEESLIRLLCSALDVDLVEVSIIMEAIKQVYSTHSPIALSKMTSRQLFVLLEIVSPNFTDILPTNQDQVWTIYRDLDQNETGSIKNPYEVGSFYLNGNTFPWGGMTINVFGRPLRENILGFWRRIILGNDESGKSLLVTFQHEEDESEHRLESYEECAIFRGPLAIEFVKQDLISKERDGFDEDTKKRELRISFPEEKIQENITQIKFYWEQREIVAATDLHLLIQEVRRENPTKLSVNCLAGAGRSIIFLCALRLEKLWQERTLTEDNHKLMVFLLVILLRRRRSLLCIESSRQFDLLTEYAAYLLTLSL